MFEDIRAEFMKAWFAKPNNEFERMVFADYLEESGDSEMAEALRKSRYWWPIIDHARRLALNPAEKEWDYDYQHLFNVLRTLILTSKRYW